MIYHADGVPADSRNTGAAVYATYFLHLKKEILT